MTNHKLMITTRDVKNPQYDGRVRYGQEQIKILPAGTKIGVFTHAEDWASVRWDGVLINLKYGFARAAIDAAIDCVPNSAGDCALKYGTDSHSFYADTLDYLVRSGAITREQMTDAFEVTRQEY